MATLFVNLVKFGPVTRRLQRWKLYTPSDKLSQKSPDWILPNVHRVVSILSQNYWFGLFYPITQGTLPRQPILGLKWASATHLHSSSWHS